MSVDKKCRPSRQILSVIVQHYKMAFKIVELLTKISLFWTTTKILQIVFVFVRLKFVFASRLPPSSLILSSNSIIGADFSSFFFGMKNWTKIDDLKLIMPTPRATSP